MTATVGSRETAGVAGMVRATSTGVSLVRIHGKLESLPDFDDAFCVSGDPIHKYIISARGLPIVARSAPGAPTPRVSTS